MATTEEDGVIIEEVIEPASDEATSALPLPPNRPGRISVEDEAVPRKAQGQTPPVAKAPVSQEYLRSMALTEAEQILPNELAMMLPTGSAAHTEVVAMCGATEEPASLWRFLADCLVELLWAPLAGCIPRLASLSEDEASAKVQLFWRCAVALCAMPLTNLSMLSKRKERFLPLSKDHLPPSDASNAEARLAHVRLNLPLFAMVADTPTEKKPISQPTVAQEDKTPSSDVASATASATEVKNAAAQEGPRQISAEDGSHPKDGEDKHTTAARHTYDVGYNKWERFDVEGELRKVDKPEPKKQLVDLETLKSKKPDYDFDDPVKALDQAISHMKEKETAGASSGSDKHAGQPSSATPPAESSENAAESKAPAPATESEGGDSKELGRNWVKVPVQDACSDDEEGPEVAREAALAESTSQVATGTATAPKIVESETHAPAAKQKSLTDSYKRWEKFDVDAALDAASDDDEPAKAARTADIEAEVLSKAPNVLPAGDASQEVEPASSDSTQSKKPAALADQYKRWDRFDVDAALDAASDDDDMVGMKPTKPKAKPLAAPPPEPKAATGKSKAEKAAAMSGTSECPLAEVPFVAETSANDTTAASLNSDYQKWDTFDPYDDVDEVSDDEGFAGDMDLDALTGPKDEISRIQKHWKREAAAVRRATKAKAKTAPSKIKEESPSVPIGPVIERPCLYRPASDPEATAAKAIGRDYNKWKEFDADGALLDLDNEGKTEEGNAMRCEARKGSAVVSAEGYQKDREEYELDQDIEQQMGGLKRVIAQRLKDAAAHKNDGNNNLRDGRAQQACAAYLRGLETMELCQQASVIMADSMADKNLRLIGDLHRNLAAAQLETGDFEGARASCDAALKISSENQSDRGGSGGDDEKALYRRATALLRLGQKQDAQKDIKALSACRGEADPAVKRLRALHGEAS